MILTRYSIIGIAFTMVLSLLISGCAAGTGGGSVGSVVIDPPRKNFVATVEGRILSDQKAIAGASVEIRGHDVSCTTDSKGYYKMVFKKMVKIGVNRIRILIHAKKPGFRSRTQGVYVVYEEKSSLDINLLQK